MSNDERAVLDGLLAYTAEESSYREDFMRRGKLYSLENHLSEPEQHVLLTEAEFFGAEEGGSARTQHARHIVLQKHSRYNPEFWHTHEFFELVYVVQGSAENHIFGQSIPLAAGDLCIMSPSVYHSLWAEDSLVLNILLKKGGFHDFFSDLFKAQNPISDFFTNALFLPDFASCLTFSTGGAPGIRSLVLAIAAEQQENDAFSQPLMKNALLSVFALILRSYAQTASRPSVIQKEHETIAKIMAILSKHYGQISLALLAEKMGYTPVYCSRLIKKYTGQNYSALVRQIKFRQAEHYLKDTSMSIEKISELCGYGNPEGFNRAFRQAYGMSPSRWRQ